MTIIAAVNYNIKTFLGTSVTAMLSNLGHACSIGTKIWGNLASMRNQKYSCLRIVTGSVKLIHYGMVFRTG